MKKLPDKFAIRVDDKMSSQNVRDFAKRHEFKNIDSWFWNGSNTHYTFANDRITDCTNNIKDYPVYTIEQLESFSEVSYNYEIY